MSATVTATETPAWTVRPAQPSAETRETRYRGLTITVNEWGWFMSGAVFAGHSVSASRQWYGSDRPSMDAMADAALLAADELLAAGWHVHAWRTVDWGHMCTVAGCGAER